MHHTQVSQEGVYPSIHAVVPSGNPASAAISPTPVNNNNIITPNDSSVNLHQELAEFFFQQLKHQQKSFYTSPVNATQHPVNLDEVSVQDVIKMISSGAPLAEPDAMHLEVGKASATSPPPADHFQAYINSPHAHSSPRSPISARDFSPELISREFSPEVDASDGEDTTLVASEQKGKDATPAVDDQTLGTVEDDWTQFLNSSAIISANDQVNKKDDSPAILDYFGQAEMVFDNHTTVVEPVQQPFSTVGQTVESGDINAPALTLEESSSPVELDANIPPQPANIFGQGPEQGMGAFMMSNHHHSYHTHRPNFVRAVNRSDSLSSITSQSSIGSSVDSLFYTTPSPSSQAHSDPFDATPLSSFNSLMLNKDKPAFDTRSSNVPATQPRSSMMESACRTVYNLILQGYPPETIDEFNQKLFSVTGQLVPMRLILEAQKKRSERFWRDSSAGETSSDSDGEAAPSVRRSESIDSNAASEHSAYTDGGQEAHQQQHFVYRGNDHGGHHTSTQHQDKSPRMRSSASALTKPIVTKASPVSGSRSGAHRRTGSYGSGASGRKRFVCPSCHKAFDRAFNLKTHMTTHDAVRDKPFVCPVADCGKDFARKHDCQRHFKTVHVKHGEASLKMLKNIVTPAHERQHHDGEDADSMSFA